MVNPLSLILTLFKKHVPNISGFSTQSSSSPRKVLSMRRRNAWATGWKPSNSNSHLFWLLGFALNRPCFTHDVTPWCHPILSTGVPQWPSTDGHWGTVGQLKAAADPPAVHSLSKVIQLPGPCSQPRAHTIQFLQPPWSSIHNPSQWGGFLVCGDPWCFLLLVPASFLLHILIDVLFLRVSNECFYHVNCPTRQTATWIWCCITTRKCSHVAMNNDTWSDVLELVNHQLVHFTPSDPRPGRWKYTIEAHQVCLRQIAFVS